MNGVGGVGKVEIQTRRVPLDRCDCRAFSVSAWMEGNVWDGGGERETK